MWSKYVNIVKVNGINSSWPHCWMCSNRKWIQFLPGLSWQNYGYFLCSPETLTEDDLFFSFSVFLNEISDLLQKFGHIWSLGRSVFTAAGARCAVVLRSLHNFVCSRTIKDLGVAERRMWKWDPGGPHPANTLRALFTLTLHLFLVWLRCHVPFPAFLSPLSAPNFSFCLAKMLPDSCFDISLFPPSHSFLSWTDDVLRFSSYFVLSFSVNGLTELFQGWEPWPLHPCCSQSMLRLPRPLER